MNNNIKSALIFVAGVAVGSFAAWKLLKDKYEQIAKDEIESVKKVYSYKKHAEKSAVNEEVAESDDEPEVDQPKVDYKNMVRDLGYTKEKGEDDMSKVRPYVISPDEFGEIYDYESVSLTYYSDGVVCDENDEPLDDIDEIIGKDSLTHFGEYEDDSVFVRNDARECDYEILKDERKFSDVNNLYPVDE